MDGKLMTNDTKATTGGMGGAITVLFWYLLVQYFGIAPPILEVVAASQVVFTAIVQGVIQE